MPLNPEFLVATTGFLSFLEGNPKTLTVAAHEKAHQIARKIRSAIKHYVEGTEWPGLSLEEVPFNFKKLDKACDDFDPTNATVWTDLVKCLPAEHAQLSGGYVGSMTRIVNYVIDQRPHNADVRMQGIRKRPPCDADQYRWKRCIEIAEEPLLVLQKLHEGRLTGAHIDCLQAMYPAIFGVITSELVQALASQGKNWNLPRNKERYLALIIGDFSDPDIQSRIQDVIAQADKAWADKGGPTQTAANKVARSFGSPGQDR